MAQAAGRRHRRSARPTTAPSARTSRSPACAARRSTARSPTPTGLRRHRRDRRRQGARPVRGRDDARAVPGRGARRRRQAAAARPHRRLGRRLDRDRRRLARRRPGVHKRVLTVAFEKQSESNAMWALSVPVPFNMPVHAGAGGYFAPHVRSYIRRSGRAHPHRRDRGRQGPAERAEEPLRAPARTPTPRSSRCWPRRCSGTRSATTRPAPPPTAPARWSSSTRTPRSPRPNPAWIHGTVMRSEATTAAERDQVNPQASRDAAAAIWKQAGITNPLEEIDWPRSTCRSPGSSRCGWRASASPSRATAGS